MSVSQTTTCRPHVPYKCLKHAGKRICTDCPPNEEDCWFTYTWICVSLKQARVPLRQQQADEMENQDNQKLLLDTILKKKNRYSKLHECLSDNNMKPEPTKSTIHIIMVITQSF